ncbi:GNAT family N-acetyltransferase [Paractinoplanes brasiliensis]|uniref:Ribosomal protein S18 acetylase RimI-like enzyme n=1 Tax=Paractinoplanes brasiliensis TaxID=52695 RepID=A0A4R6JCW4_9ACTN|nr:GNAT family N-acetyltransferase [Actinoplanes brasiliensis]TDO32385.1 ribosomal protein S18 acetylase RimI-like enzyme [Actinoplanes brasiliensis]GID27747.1 N-acetyltransferase [Actinoplanes brasiliensis]
MIEIVKLSGEDWGIWRELRLAALAEAPYAFGSRLSDWRGDGDKELRWRDRLTIPGSHNVVAVLDGAPVGMASGVPAGRDGQVELISMWVAPAARGRGVGDRLIEAIESWAVLACGAVELRLAVMPGNEKAIALYRRAGFAETGELGDPAPDGQGRELVLAKALHA